MAKVCSSVFSVGSLSLEFGILEMLTTPVSQGPLCSLLRAYMVGCPPSLLPSSPFSPRQGRNFGQPVSLLALPLPPHVESRIKVNSFPPPPPTSFPCARPHSAHSIGLTSGGTCCDRLEAEPPALSGTQSRYLPHSASRLAKQLLSAVVLVGMIGV